MLVSEVIYSILTLCKQNGSDDSTITEEFVLFLAKKYRAFLIKKEQEKEKSTTDIASEFEYQELCLDLEKVPAIDGDPCTGGYYLRTTKPIPKLLEGAQPRVYPMDFFQSINMSYVSRERMRYVGNNKFLRNIIYVALGPDFHLYLNSSNHQFFYLTKLRIEAIFEDFEEAADLACCQCNENPCDIMDAPFPIREYLVPMLIELVVKEITGGMFYRPDTKNNASDDFPEVNRRS